MQKIEMEQRQSPKLQTVEKVQAGMSRNSKVKQPIYTSMKDQRSLNSSKMRGPYTAVSSVRNNKTPITSKFSAP